MLEFGDTCILSNSNLPYWNDKGDIMIWIKMALNDEDLKPFNVDVFINCENADGFTKPIKIRPKELIEQFNKEVNKEK